MDKLASTDLLYIAVFFLGGLGFAVGPFIIAYLLAPRSTRNTRKKTKQLIECGMDPIGDAWIKFGVVYYLYALMFVAFAVDILFLFPAALVYNKPGVVDGLSAFLEILLFVGILSLIILYAWKKGVFKWERKIYKTR
ncbi:MAG: NADH-quinone oxidoreductase subunit A [Thermodesulfobacteriota bacterium]